MYVASVELIGIAECVAKKPESVCTHLELNLFYGDRYKSPFQLYKYPLREDDLRGSEKR